jgi:hypothetical protein
MSLLSDVVTFLNSILLTPNGKLLCYATIASSEQYPSICTAICGGVSRVALYRDLSVSLKERIWDQQLSFLVDSAGYCIKPLNHLTTWQFGTALGLYVFQT